MTKNRLAASLLSATLLNACTAQQPPSALDTPTSPAAAAPAPTIEKFDGFPLRGTAEEVKKAGLTECESEWGNRLVCRLDQPIAVLGVEATDMAAVLTGKNASDQDELSDPPPLDGLTLKDLTFRELRFWFTDAAYDAKCVSKLPASQQYNPPVACAKPDTIAQFREALRKDGWVEVNGKARWTNYLKPGTPAVVTVHIEHGLTDKVDVETLPLDQVTERLADYEARMKRIQHVPGASLVEEMKASSTPSATSSAN